MNFSNVQVLGANSASQFFGDQVRWKSILDISIEGSFIDLNSNDVTAIHSQVNTFETSAFGGPTFYSNITINGINFGEGYVSNFAAAPDNVDVKDKKYTASITIPVEGNLNTLTTDNLGSVSKTNFEFIDTFSENSVFTKGEGIKDSYNQTVSLNISPKIKANGKSVAETIIKSFLNSNQLTSLIGGQYQKTNIKKYYEQSYDEINNSYTCNANFELYTRAEDNEEDLLVNRSVRVEFNSDGSINVTESGDVIGNNPGVDSVRYQKALTKVKNLMGGAFGRLSSYVPSSGSVNHPLINQAISENMTTIPFEGRVSYSITFTNSKEVIINSGYWSFTINATINEGGETVLTEDGSIIGFGDITLNKSKFNNARSLFDTKKSGIKSRLEEYYKGNETIKELSSSVVFNDVEGSVQYSTSYTDSDSLLDNQIVRKAVSTVTEDYNRNLFSTFNIVGLKEIAQIQRNLLQNNTTVNIRLNGRFQESYKEYFNFAKDIADQYKSSKYISDVSYTYSPTNREFNLTITYFRMPTN
jgi:hypothetical protein